MYIYIEAFEFSTQPSPFSIRAPLSEANTPPSQELSIQILHVFLS